MFRLLQEKDEDSTLTILRFRSLVTWLANNSLDDDKKDEVLKMINFEDFTFKDLSSDVWKSGLYPIDEIMERMGSLFQTQNKDLERNKKALEAKGNEWLKTVLELATIKQQLENKTKEVEKLNKDKIENEKSAIEDMKAVRDSVLRSQKLGSLNCWRDIPSNIKKKYSVFC